jgi:hypothetical protein
MYVTSDFVLLITKKTMLHTIAAVARSALRKIERLRHLSLDGKYQDIRKKSHAIDVVLDQNIVLNF